MERIGLYGGSFNPIHLGHLRTAWEIKETFRLNQVVFVPASIPPHKRSTQLETADDRMEMIRLAITPQSRFALSDVELKRSGPSYTIDTIRHLKSGVFCNSQLFFILGSDAFLEIHTWKSYKALLAQVPFIVMVRPDFESNDVKDQLQKIHDFLLSNISDQYCFNATENRYDHPKKKSVYVHQVTPLNISSTKIRKILKSGKSIQFLVPNAVFKYINTKGLYK